MIDARQLTKKYGQKTAVDGLDFVVQPGTATGFLGPNRQVHDDAHDRRPRRPHERLRHRERPPLRPPPGTPPGAGALLEATSIPGRSAYNHLRALALTHGIPARRAGPNSAHSPAPRTSKRCAPRCAPPD